MCDEDGSCGVKQIHYEKGDGHCSTYNMERIGFYFKHDSGLTLNPTQHTTQVLKYVKENVYKCQWCKIKNQHGMNIGCQNIALTSRAYKAQVPSSHWDKQQFA